jgi:hypothetical protein
MHITQRCWHMLALLWVCRSASSTRLLLCNTFLALVLLVDMI